MFSHSQITQRIDNAQTAIESLRDKTDAITSLCNTVVSCLQRGGTVYTCGNGGSAAEALHLAEELIGRYRSNRRPLRAICLNADPTALTCIANDFGYDQIFARQCEALLRDDDLLIVFSTSGNSQNLVQALKIAEGRGVASAAIVGREGGDCSAVAEQSIYVHSNDSGHIQEAHQVVLHIICEAVEGAFSEKR